MALEALDRLREGNQRFVSGVLGHDVPVSRRAESVAGQNPFAIVLGCSDSRVPVELVFDQGLGDLFVVRVAGNVAAATQIASVEFAAHQFGTRLVLVLGHSGCGAVAATLEALQDPTTQRSEHLDTVIDHIRPSVEPILERQQEGDAAILMQRAVRENVMGSVRQLRQQSPLLQGLIQDAGLLIVGAEYSLETGVVNFFNGLPENPSR